MFSVRRAPSLRRVFTVGRPMLRETGPTLEADDAPATAARPRRRAAPAFRPRLPPLRVRDRCRTRAGPLTDVRRRCLAAARTGPAPARAPAWLTTTCPVEGAS